MTDLRRLVGSTSVLESRTFGTLRVESVQLTEAVDGDLLVLFGQPFKTARPLVRIHSECVFAELLDSALCDCADQLSMALAALTESGCGILVYLRMDGRGAGLAAKVAATQLEVDGMDTWESRTVIGVEPEGRSFEAVAELLVDRGVRSVSLLTNNPAKVNALQHLGIDVQRVDMHLTTPSVAIRRLYRTKAERFGHFIPDSAQ